MCLMQTFQNIRSIDICRLHNINPSLSYNLPKTEIGEGMYRELPEFALRLARFYLIVNKNRHDKLKKIDTFPKKNPESILFLIAIGGDEAPITGTTFLISFINVAKRVASSSENFLLFGGNVKENGNIVQRYVQKLTSDLTYLGNQTFTISIEEITYFIEFKVQSVPSDMKMLPFLGGELSNAAFYFTTFANINKKDCNDVTKIFSLDGSKSWKPFDYEKHLSDAALVIAKKKEAFYKRNDTISSPVKVNSLYFY